MLELLLDLRPDDLHVPYLTIYGIFSYACEARRKSRGLVPALQGRCSAGYVIELMEYCYMLPKKPDS